MVTRQYCDLCNKEVKFIADFYLINIKKNGINQLQKNLDLHTEVCKDCFFKISDFINKIKSGVLKE